MIENKLIPINVDYSAFDTSCSEEMISIAMHILSDIVDLRNAPEDLLQAIAVKTVHTRYIIYNPYTSRIEWKQKHKAIPSGIGFTGILGLIISCVTWTYGLIQYYGYDDVYRIMRSIRSKDTFPSIALGDDVLSWVKDFKHLPEICKKIEDHFGMVISYQSTKTAVGVDFLQELLVNDKVEYPLGRTATSALYTERAKGLGWAEWVMAWGSMLYNMKTNPSQSLVGMAAIIARNDASKLGLVDPKNGGNVTEAQFSRQLNIEAQEHGNTPKEVLWDGDPSKEDRFTKDGSVSSAFLGWLRTISLAANATNLGNNKKFMKGAGRDEERKTV